MNIFKNTQKILRLNEKSSYDVISPYFMNDIIYIGNYYEVIE